MMEIMGATMPNKPMTDRYTEYTELEAVGAWIGIMSCLECGATILLDKRDKRPAALIHTEWHMKYKGILKP